jgi:hypothetical protein
MRLASTLTFWSKGLDVMRVLAVWKGLSIICSKQDATAEEAAQHAGTTLAHLHFVVFSRLRHCSCPVAVESL